MKTDPYFQFTLCATARKTTEYDLVNSLMDYSVVESAPSIRKSKGEVMCYRIIARLAESDQLPEDYDDTDAHVNVCFAASVINIRYRSLRPAFRHHAEVKQFVMDFERRHGPDPKVRIRQDFMFEARDKRGSHFREFLVLAAVCSCVGNKPGPVRITQETIRYRAGGYRSKKVFAAEVKSASAGASFRMLASGKPVPKPRLPLSSWEIRRTLEALVERKIIARFTYSRRQSFYSTRLTIEELAKAVIALKTRRSDFWNYQRLLEASALAAIREYRASPPETPPALSQPPR